MKKIEYYYVPDELKILPWENNLLDFNPEEKKEILVGDSRSKIASLSFFQKGKHRFLTDNLDVLSNIMWGMKEYGEILTIKRMQNNESTITKDIEINNYNNLRSNLSEMINEDNKYITIYSIQEKVNKVIYPTEGEMLDIFVDESRCDNVESVLNRFALKVTYRQYELDED